MKLAILVLQLLLCYVVMQNIEILYRVPVMFIVTCLKYKVIEVVAIESEHNVISTLESVYLNQTHIRITIFIYIYIYIYIYLYIYIYVYI